MMTNLTRFWSFLGVAAVVTGVLFFGGSGCTSDSETIGCGESCEAGFICESNRCVQLCNADSECASGSDRCIKGLCVSTSTLTGCGNKVREGSEECDDGNSNNSDGCLNDCSAALCGDGFVFIGGDEECDDAGGNLNEGACTSECKKAVCGDGFIHDGVEFCDEGSTNSDDWALEQRCNSTCSGYGPYCGDGMINLEQESCDGACPGNCVSDNDPCTTDTYSGSADECTALCEYIPVTTCNQSADGCCPAGCTSDTDTDCIPLVGLVGVVNRFDLINLTPQSAVRVQVAGTEQFSLHSDESGNFSVPGTVLENSTVELQWSQALGSGVDQFQAPSQILTRQVLTSPAEQGSIAQDLTVVSFDWLTKVAIDCGVPDTSATTQGEVNANYVPYAILVGDLVDSNGAPVAGVPDYAISVQFSAQDFLNNNPANICFLDEGNLGAYTGTNEKQSTATGKFVIFKMRKSAISHLGSGEVTVRVLDYPHSVDFQESVITLNAGNIGYVRLTTTDTMPAITKVIDFSDDVMPVFENRGCTGCHKSGGGADAPPRLRYNTTTTETFPAVWGSQDANSPVSTDTVFANLTGAGKTCGNDCDTGVRNDTDNPENNTFPRVCIDSIDCSLLLARPLQSDTDAEGPIHPTPPFPNNEDIDYLTFRAWIEQGAHRYSKKDFENDILPTFAASGCSTGCHQQNMAGGNKLILTGNVETVYFELLNGSNTPLCEGNPNALPYICADQPLNSKLFQYFNNVGANGHNPADPFVPPSINLEPRVRDLLVWISEGALITPP